MAAGTVVTVRKPCASRGRCIRGAGSPQLSSNRPVMTKPARIWPPICTSRLWLNSSASPLSIRCASSAGESDVSSLYGSSLEYRASDGLVDEREQQRVVANRRQRTVDRVEKLEPEPGLLTFVVPRSLKDVGLRIRGDVGFRSHQRDGRCRRRCSISRRASDQGRAASGFARWAASRSRNSARWASEIGSWDCSATIRSQSAATYCSFSSRVSSSKPCGGIGSGWATP